MRKLRVEVSEGEFVLENIWIVKDVKDLVVIYLDTRSKYPEIGFCCDRELSIESSDRALHTDAGMKGFSTIVKLRGLRGKWSQAFETGRYSIYWVFYKQKKSGRQIWDNKN